MVPKRKPYPIIYGIFVLFLLLLRQAVCDVAPAHPIACRAGDTDLANQLQCLVHGTVLTDSGDAEEFEEACRGWSAPAFAEDYGLRPALLVQPTGARVTLSHTA